MEKIKLAIFASGSGSNVKNIIKYFKDHLSIEIEFVLSNKSDAPIVFWCKENKIDTVVLNNEKVDDGNLLNSICQERAIKFIILAGYLRKIPAELINAFENKMINIHPSLLPKYGGKGMYGNHVHKAVKAANENQTGITIHFVNKDFDEGRYIAQFYTEILPSDSVEDIQVKIQSLEQKYFPTVIKKTIIA
jgi:phosphoribosylglycinamide formyltransferase-1